MTNAELDTERIFRLRSGAHESEHQGNDDETRGIIAQLA
jgi:hypothetical protein